MKIISTNFPNSERIEQEIQSRKLRVNCSNTTDELRTSLARSLFPQVSDCCKICLTLEDVVYSALPADGLRQLLEGQQFPTVVDLRAGIGVQAAQLLDFCSTLICFEDSSNRFLSLANNLSLLDSDNKHIFLKNASPDVFSGDLEVLRPSLVVFEFPMHMFHRTRALKFQIGHYVMNPYQLASEVLKFSKLLIRLPASGSINPVFTIAPKKVRRNGRHVYDYYLVSSIDELIKPKVVDLHVVVISEIKIMSSFASGAQMADSLEARRLVPRETDSRFEARFHKLLKSFPDIVYGGGQLAIDYNSVRYAPHREDMFPELLLQNQVNIDRVYELFSWIGSDACAFAQNGSSIRCHEPDESKFLCLVRNFLVHRQEGLFYSRQQVELLNTDPDVLGDSITKFAPTVISAPIPWRNYMIDGKISAIIQGKEYTPTQLAKLVLTRDPPIPIVFKLPSIDRYDPQFSVSPIPVYRVGQDQEEYLAYNVYILRSLRDVRGI